MSLGVSVDEPLCWYQNISIFVERNGIRIAKSGIDILVDHLETPPAL